VRPEGESGCTEAGNGLIQADIALKLLRISLIFEIFTGTQHHKFEKFDRFCKIGEIG
jgi:hypothetical protein